MRIKKHLLNERVITIGNIPAGEEKTFKYDDWYFVISHAYDEDEDYEYTVYVTDSLTSKEYQYVYACENREEMMDYIARFLKNHKIDKEPEWDGEFNESKSYDNDIKKKISEIVHNNGDIIKENYNRYLSPFMISPVIIWNEHDESFDEIYDTLVGNGPTPTYARLANYDLKPLSNEYQRLLDTEIICLCATIDNHMLKVGIMFDDDMYNCLMACGFTPNGDGTWDISGENYSQEKAEKYYLDEYIKPCIEIAKKRLNEIHTVFDGEIYNNEKSYWGDILFGNSGDDTEPETDGSELDESKQLNENESETYEANNIDDLLHKMYLYSPRLDEGRSIFYCNNYTIVVEYITDEDQDIEDDRHYYKAKLYDSEIEDETDAYITEFSYFNYGTLCLNVADYIKNNPLVDHADEDTEPEDDGDELNETVEGNSSWETNPPQEIGESIKFKVGLTSYEAVFTRDNGFKKFYDLRIFNLNDNNVWTAITFDDWDDLVHWAKRYARKDTSEPEWNGEFDELDESWLPGAEWLDEPTPIGHSETHFYKGYDFAVEGVRDSDGDYYSLRVFIHDITDDDDALVQQESFDTWDELAFYVRDYVDEHPIQPDKKDDDTEPETDGSELDETKIVPPEYDDDFSNEWKHSPLYAGEEVTYNYKGYELFIDASVEDEYGEITYTLDIYNKGGHKKLVEASFVDWDKLVEYVDDFIYNDSEADPEEDGSEFNERFDMKTIKKQINEIVEKANG